MRESVVLRVMGFTCEKDQNGLNRKFIQTRLTSPEIEDIADKLEDIGLKDYFDRLIAATAIVNDFKLLTEDKKFHNLLRKFSLFLS